MQKKQILTKLPTISSISFKIFRTNYLLSNKLPIIKGNIPNDIRNVYYGVVVKVFRNEGKNLGLFKLEHEIDHAYFISPKLYALKTITGKTIVKAKGTESRLDFNSFENLIENQAIIQAQER